MESKVAEGPGQAKSRKNFGRPPIRRGPFALHCPTARPWFTIKILHRSPGPACPVDLPRLPRRFRMAANTSFKVQCPSCEAMVPIRDPNLVGKKIDCPKCKYRFVVEEPDGDEGGDRPARKAAKPKAKKGGNNVLILGSILGGVALIVLGVVVFM